jgi:hypothetical protein
MWGNSPIAFATEVSHTSPSPLSQAVTVHPLNYIRPAEIVVNRAIGNGVIVLNINEMYGYDVWEHLSNDYRINGFQDLADVLHWQNRHKTEFSVASEQTRILKVIRHPQGNIYVTEYKNPRIVDLREDETVNAGAMTNVLQVTVWYTHKVKAGFPGGVNLEPDGPIARQF